MAKIPSKQERAQEFGRALLHDRAEADRMLSKHPELIDSPIYGESESALHFFAVENQVEIVRWLLSKGANPNGISESGYPLHDAAQLGNEEVCRDLLKAGSEPNRCDFMGETALHKASQNGYVKIIDLLLANGADPGIAETCGELPVDQALPRKRELVRAAFARHERGRET